MLLLQSFNIIDNQMSKTKNENKFWKNIQKCLQKYNF